MLDAVRLGPADDATAVTAAQLREVVDRLRAAGHWQPGRPEHLDRARLRLRRTRLAFLLADLPVMLVGRLRSDRVLARPSRTPLRCSGRPLSHGPLLFLADPRPGPSREHTTQHRDHPLRHRARPAQLASVSIRG